MRDKPTAIRPWRRGAQLVRAGGVGGFLCGAAGTGISTFVPWERVCR